MSASLSAGVAGKKYISISKQFLTLIALHLNLREEDSEWRKLACKKLVLWKTSRVISRLQFNIFKG